MISAPLEPVTRPTPTPAASGAEPAPTIRSPTAMFPMRGTSLTAGFQELGQAYQAIASRNAEKLTSSIRALASVKTPTEFVELQQKLLTESMATAVSDGATIAKLTTAALTASFQPMRKQIGDLRAGAEGQE